MIKKQSLNIIKEIENCSNNDTDEENSLLMSAERHHRKRTLTKYEIVNMKILPSIFFILFLLIFCFMILKFVPNFYFVSKDNHFYHIKSSVKSFYEYFSDQNLILKVKK